MDDPQRFLDDLEQALAKDQQDEAMASWLAVAKLHRQMFTAFCEAGYDVSQAIYAASTMMGDLMRGMRGQQESRQDS